ncbi:MULTISPECIES: CRISPR-associated endonuclease Cas2 [Halocatena]|uniref:CRISPR-associated endoribonuclease Cas2 n=3 Tax=Halocatena TaxID=2907493 RepID=A0A8U0A825_9EURY|nr:MULTISPECIES: CRISPR-associated endonuclease Cas2 [Halocatena]RRJ27522.1 CRISPR-associated endonuclease Cas2 [Halocatena pleomorpha]UPM45285.1 CRISPR-associated endonuclease Cas2 [Halocatena salina]
MFVLIVYDVPADRTRIYRKLLRTRLEHIQQSVFYGDVTPGQLVDIKHDIEAQLRDDDSVIVFEAETAGFVDYTAYGPGDEPGSRFT